MRVRGNCVRLQGHAAHALVCGIASGAKKCHSEWIAYNVHMVVLLDIFCMEPSGTESLLSSYS